MIFKNFKPFATYNSPFTYKGFTLAETIITLLIIGVVAAITIPALIKSMPSNNKVMFKKAYNTLSQGVNNLINDDVNYPSTQTGALWDSGTSSYSGATVSLGFNFDNGANYGDIGKGYLKFCDLLSNQLNTVGTVNCDNPVGTGWGSFTTSDGVLWQIYEGWSSSTTAPANDDFPLSNTDYAYQSKALIDVNGSKGPNCTLDTSNTYSKFNYSANCKDPDQFIIGIRYDGKLQVGCSTLPICSTITDQNAINILLNPTNNTK